MTIQQDMIRARLEGATLGVSSALADPKTPDQYSEAHKEAVRLGVSDEAFMGMTPEQKAARETERLNLADWYATTPVFMQRIAGDSSKYRFVKDDPLNATTIEKVWNTVTGGPGKADGIFSSLANSLARGGYALANNAPLGNVSNLGGLEQLNKRQAELDRIDKALAEGRPATEVFNRNDQMSAEVLRAYYEAHRDDIRAELESQRGKLAQDIHYNRMATELFPQSEKAARVMGQDGGFWEVGKRVLSNPSVLADIGPESLVQYAPMAPAAAVAGAMGGLPAAMLATGVFSYEQDKNSAIAGQINEAAKNPTAQAVLSVLNDSELMQKFTEKAEKHALPVAVLDALSLGVAGFAPVTRLVGQGVSRSTKILAESAVQMPLQGVMGGAGEALGQVNAEGKVTSWSEVWAEFLGEHFTAPVEMASAGSRAFASAYEERVQAEQRAEVFTQISEAAKVNPLVQRAPDVAEDYFQAVGEATNTPNVLLDAQALQQAGLLESLVQVSPAAASQAEEALRTGGEISIPTGEFLARVAPTELSEQLTPMLHFPDGPSLQQASSNAGGAQQKLTQSISGGVNPQSAAYGVSLSEVGKKIDAELGKLPISDSEKRTIGGLVVSLAESGASDLGITPEEFWDDYGFNILDPAVQAPAGFANSNGSYFPNSKTIARWASADQSTLLHETGHWFFDVRSAIAAKLEQKGGLTEGEKHYLDATTDALKWLGVNSAADWNALSFEQKRALQEKFARTYEAYLYEGKAPTKGLQRIFRQFSKWLKKIYMVLGAIPGQDLNANTREIFDRMFVAHQQVEEAKLRRWLDEMLEAGFTDDETLRGYHEAIRERDDEAAEYLQSRLMKDMAFLGRWRDKELRRMATEGKRLRKQLAKDKGGEYDKSRVGKVVSLFKKGIEVNGAKVKPKILPEEIAMLGLSAEQVKRLNEMGVIYSEKKGETFEDGENLAHRMGYASLSEMAQDLLANGDRYAAVNSEVEKEMVNNYSEFADPNAIRKAVDKALMGPLTQRIIATEIAALERTQKRAIDTSFFREMAKTSLMKRKLSEIKPEAFRRQASKKAMEAKRAMKNGDFALAARLKREQLYQTCLAHEAQTVIDNQKKMLNRYKRFASKKEIKGLETRYLIAIQNLLAKAHVKLSAGLDRDLVPLSAFIQECIDNAEVPPTVASDLEARLNVGSQNGFKDMTVELAEELADAIRQLEKLGRDVNTVMVNAEKAELATVTGEINTAIENNAQTRGRGEKDNLERTGIAAHIKDAMARIGMSHARIPSLLACMEGTRFGKLFEAITKPADEANSKEEQLKTKFAIKLYKAFKPLMPEGLFSEKQRFYQKQQVSLTRSQVIAIALNMGNEGNLNRLVEGSPLWRSITQGRKLTAQDFAEIVQETLTKEELQAVQKVWDVFKEIVPDIQAQQKRLTGRSVEFVEATPVSFTLPTGEVVQLNGGYYPIVYDRKASEKGSDLAEFNDIMARASGVMNSNHTFGGFLEKRAKSVSGLAISLTPRGAFEGLDNEIHRLAWEEWVVNTQKILKRIRPMIRRYWGDSAVRAVDKWLQDIATGTRGQSEMGDVIATTLRYGISMAGIGFNLVTALIQPLGLVNTTAVIGHRWTAKGIAEFLKHGPTASFREVAGKSAMMENRARTRFRELTEIQAAANGKIDAVRNEIMRWAYKPIVLTQMLVDIPTWLGGYNKALSEGKTEAEAIAVADRVVIDAQGSGRTSDLSELERGGPWLKLFTVFYTFFNAILNNVMVSAHTKNKLAVATDVLMILCLQPVVETFVREGIKASMGGGDEDEWFKNSVEKAPWSVLDFNLGLFVGLRELANTDRTYGGPGGTRKIADVGRLITQIGQGEIDEAFVKSAVSAAGSIFGLPAVPINRAITGAKALSEGDTDNPLVLFFGYSRY